MSDNEVALTEIRKHLRQVQVPDQWSKVYKDECALSFDTPESEGGLYTSLSSFLSFGRDFVGFDHNRTGNCLYLYQKWTKVFDEEKQQEKANKPITKLAIGVEGGFDVGEPAYHFEKQHAVVVLPSMLAIPYPNSDLPMIVSQSVDAILAKDDASKAIAVEQWEEKKQVSKYAKDLPQLPATFKISPNPKDWKCQESGLTENLWLNLSTGYIGSGRRNWDGTGGTGAALRHFEETGSLYPLVVKLGTITPHGADVYSYAPDEDDMVEDPYLADHLAHWGINMMKMQKTEKTMAELDIELNLSYEFDKITEAGQDIQPLSGPGFVGLRNLGNSCYCNTVYQVLFSMDKVAARYANQSLAEFSPDAPSNLNTQLVKLAHGLLSDRYAPQGSISPGMIKGLLAQGHQEFSTPRQQDALHYFQHVLTRIERADKASGIADSISNLIKFQLETRLQCNASGQVRYSSVEENALALVLPLELGTNHQEVQDYQAKLAAGEISKNADPVMLNIPFDRVLENWASAEYIQDFYSSATKSRGTANKTVRFKTFPEYLTVQLSRYILNDDWTEKKLDVLVPVPETLNLESLRSSGALPGEVLLPEEAAPNPNDKPAPAAIYPDDEIVAQLLSMGFSENACKRAAVGVQNSSYDAAANWLMEHMEDGDINDPLPAGSGGSEDQVDPAALEMLMSMGIDKSHATRGLKETGGDMERAADWCFSHDPEPDEPAAVAGVPDAKASALTDGPGSYELFAIISHIGKDTGSGHYVCHIKKNGVWAIFNDRKVAASANPPFALGYLYFFKRKTN